MRKICVFTGTRAEFGLLRRVMQSIQDSPDLTLQIVATGMHLSPEFGMTIQKIRAAGFEPDETIEMLMSGHTPTAICKSMGLALIGYGETKTVARRRYREFVKNGIKQGTRPEL